ncbi:MAG TPA: AMP-binding protein [Acidimicrobiia bacterium]|jgi:acyl-CoA synthetase (AMP-forming)/AMP-acid ligase II
MTFDWRPHEPEPARARQYVHDGFWDDFALGQVLAEGLHDAAGAAFVVRSDRRPYQGTLGDVDALARRVARGLAARGIRAGDAVAFQLPNWVEAAATFYAVAYLGAVVVPIVHFYGTKEVGYILRRTRVKALVTADRFGAQDFLVNLAALRAEGLPDLEWCAVVSDDGATTGVPGDCTFTDLVAADSIDGPITVDPSAPALIAYTSGTTADPKGVVHVHRTINAEIRQLGAVQDPPAWAPVDVPDQITGAPVGHGIGMLAALLIPVWRRRPINLIDVWDPGRVLAAMRAEHLGAGQGSTVFLTSLLDHPDFDPAVHVALMPQIGLGGSAVPLAVCERALALGIQTMRSFGCTEHPSITGSTWSDPWEQRSGTDGRALPGVEMRMVDEDGHDVPVGEPGEIWSRGPDCCFGYTDPVVTAASFEGSWYCTGDIGVLDERGCLRITDRKKDIIIRGGENISAAEVEELMMRLPGVAEVAVVAAPDARLGEHAAAFVRMQPGGGGAPALDAVRAHLEQSGLARPKWPEEVHDIDVFPRTPSGKVQKFALRARLRGEAR